MWFRYRQVRQVWSEEKTKTGEKVTRVAFVCLHWLKRSTQTGPAVTQSLTSFKSSGTFQHSFLFIPLSLSLSLSLSPMVTAILLSHTHTHTHTHWTVWQAGNVRDLNIIGKSKQVWKKLTQFTQCLCVRWSPGRLWHFPLSLSLSLSLFFLSLPCHSLPIDQTVTYQPTPLVSLLLAWWVERKREREREK